MQQRTSRACSIRRKRGSSWRVSALARWRYPFPRPSASSHGDIVARASECPSTPTQSAAGGKPGTAASSASGGFLSPLAIKSNMQASARGQAGFIAPSRYMSPGSVMRPPPARSSERVPKGLATSSAIPGTCHRSSYVEQKSARSARKLIIAHCPCTHTHTHTHTHAPHKGDPIHPVEWRRYTLVQVLPLNHNTKIFRFGLAKRDLALSLPLGLHIQVRYARTVLPSHTRQPPTTTTPEPR
jgi:hypothetical protein